MNSIRTNRVARMVIVAMTFIGWFVLSNHCALGRMAQAKKEHTCCHNDAPRPAKEPMDGKRGVECCKSLHAVMPDSVKAADLTPTFVIAVLASLLAHEVETDRAAVVASDTGPPRAASFSELVLHRSLRAHAPPFPA